MSGILSYVPIANRFIGEGAKPKTVHLPSVEIQDLEANPDRRARILKHLLKANHVNYSIVYRDSQSNNNGSHLLCSAYLLGASDNHLNEIYEAQSQNLESWKPSPAELIDEDWRDFFGDTQYQRAYVDYFEDKVVMEHSYDWKQLLQRFLFNEDEPLFHGLIGSLGHPLIHLGYAYEMDSKEIAMEALGLAAVQYSPLHKYLDDKTYTRKSALISSDPLDLLIKMSNDARFSDVPKIVEQSQIENIFEHHEELIMEYWNGWCIDDPARQLQLSQECAVALLVATVQPGSRAYSFLMVHLLTASHAMRVMLPLIPTGYHITLLREWWLLVLAVFVAMGRPLPDPNTVEKDLKGNKWKYVEHQALNSAWSKDSHYVEAIRTMREAARTWGDANEGYLQAAVTFADNFNGWVKPQ